MSRMLGAVLFAAAVLQSGAAFAANPADQARAILKEAQTPNGLCCVLGENDPEFALALLRQSNLLLHVLETSPENVSALRVAAGKNRFGLDRLVVECAVAMPLPHADNLLDLVIAPVDDESALAALSLPEIQRALRPGGKCFIGGGVSANALKAWGSAASLVSALNPEGNWIALTKPVPQGLDAWSHWEHGPDNNPVSMDSVIKAPYRTQWLAEPYYIAMPAITTAAGGRTFLAMGHIAHHEREEAWLNTLLARNGYNGTELWRKQLPDGYLVHRSAFVATPQTFYMIDLDGQGCLLLDPETGAEKGRVRLPETPGHWKWMALVGDTLYALIGERPDPRETTVVRSNSPAWSWGELSKGYYQEEPLPWGFGETLAAYSLEKQQLLWTHREETQIDSRAMAMGDGRLYFYAPQSRLGCLDATTGNEVWRNDNPDTRALIEEEGQGLASTPGFRTACFCLYTPQGLFFEGQTRMNIVAVSKEDGSVMWHRPKTTSNPNVIYLDGNILVGIGEEGSTLAIDPKTGETIQDLGFKKRSCVRLTATQDSLFCRGWPEGTTRYDRNTRLITFDGAMRPACNDGVIAANGLLYSGPWACDCNLSVIGAVAQCSANGFEPEALTGTRIDAADHLEAPVEALWADEGDWYTYRGGNQHGAAAKAPVSSALLPLWTWEPPSALAPTAPVAAAGRVFIAGDDGIVRALNAATGKELWQFPTAGPIRQSPTLWKGRVFAGSGDGCVYALEAATGRLLWRFRAAPAERRTMLYGRLCSTWPVNTGVILHQGTAYFAAGLIDYDGTYVYAVDAETGELRWANNATGHLDKALRKGVSAQGNLTLLGNALWMGAGNVMPPASYDLTSGAFLSKAGPGDGAPQANRGEEIGVFHDAFLLSGGRLRYSSVENVINPGRFVLSKGEKVLMELATGRVAPAWDDALMVCVPNRDASPVAYDAQDLAAQLEHSRRIVPKRHWHARSLEGARVEALALARDAVIAACRTPVARFLAPRYRVCLLSREDGALRWDADLPGAPRLNGVAVDRDGRLLVALADGRVSAFGDYQALQANIQELAGQAAGNAPEKQEAVKRLRQALSTVHDPEGRAMLMDQLRNLGVDLFSESKAAGALYRWHLLGPVPWDDFENPLDKALIGEPEVDPSKPCRVAGQTLQWAEYITVDSKGRVDLDGIFGRLEARAVYAYAEFTLPEEGPILVKIGSNDGFKCWLNGKEIGRFEGGRIYRADQDTLPAIGRQGVNRLLVKVTQQGGAWTLGARITRPDGIPVQSQ